MEARMRILVAALAVAAVGISFDTAKADPYRWCADLTINRGGASNCYFVTLEQCRATVSGVGGYCRPNPFYDGLPVVTPPEPRRPRTRT
jgi:hypothetical protein